MASIKLVSQVRQVCEEVFSSLQEPCLCVQVGASKSYEVNLQTSNGEVTSLDFSVTTKKNDRGYFTISGCGISEPLFVTRSDDSSEASEPELRKALKLLLKITPYPLEEAKFVYWKGGEPSAIVYYYCKKSALVSHMYVAGDSIPQELCDLSLKDFWRLRKQKKLTPVSTEAPGDSGEKYLLPVANDDATLHGMVWRGPKKWNNEFFLFAGDGSRKIKVISAGERSQLIAEAPISNKNWRARQTGRPVFP